MAVFLYFRAVPAAALTVVKPVIRGQAGPAAGPATTRGSEAVRQRRSPQPCTARDLRSGRHGMRHLIGSKIDSVQRQHP
jgi:hypothetical protein